MRSTEKTILFARLTVDRKTHQWPVAVFNTKESAGTYAAYLKMAHSVGHTETVRTLDVNAKVDDNGHLIPGTKFSLQTLPYEPSPASGIDEEEPAPAAQAS